MTAPKNRTLFVIHDAVLAIDPFVYRRRFMMGQEVIIDGCIYRVLSDKVESNGDRTVQVRL